MRKRRDSNLTLTAEILALADRYFEKRCFELDHDFRKDLFTNKQQYMVTRNRLIINNVNQAYLDLARAKVRARTDTFLDAYKRAELVPSEGDINEISWELQDIILNVATELSVEVRSMLEREASRIVEAAVANIRIFIQEQDLARGDTNTGKRDSQNSVQYNIINIGENRGSIQQGGSQNIQNTTGEKSED